MRFPCGFAIEPYIFVPSSSRSFKFIFFFFLFFRSRLTPLTFILDRFSVSPSVLHIFRTIQTARGEPRESPRSKGSRCYYYSRESRHKHLGVSVWISPGWHGMEFRDQSNGTLDPWNKPRLRGSLYIQLQVSFVKRQELFLFYFFSFFFYWLIYGLFFLSVLIRVVALFINRFRGFRSLKRLVWIFIVLGFGVRRWSLGIRIFLMFLFVLFIDIGFGYVGNWKII